MSGPSEDDEFNFIQDRGDAFDSLGNDARPPVAPDEFDKLDEEDGGLSTPQKRSPTLGTTEPGGLDTPTKKEPGVPGRPWLKTAAVIAGVGVIGAGSVFFSLPLLNGSPAPKGPRPRPNPVGAANQAGNGSLTDGKSPGLQKGGDAESPAGQQPPSPVASATPLRNVEELVKDLKSSDVNKISTAREEIVKAVILPDSKEQETLKALKQRTAAQSGANSPGAVDSSVENDITDFLLELKLKALGEGGASDALNRAGSQVAPASVPVAAMGADNSAVTILPWRYSVFLTAVLAAADPATNEVYRKIEEAKKKLDAFPKTAHKQRCEHHLILSRYYQQVSQPGLALEHLASAETHMIKGKLLELRPLIEEHRKAVVDDAVRTIQKGVDELQNSTKVEVLQAIKSMLKAGPLQLLSSDKVSRPETVDEVSWNSDVQLVKSLAQLDDAAWGERTAVDVIKDYYRLSRLHVTLTDAGVTANLNTKDAVLIAAKVLLNTGILQSVANGKATRPEGIEEQIWNDDLERTQTAVKRTAEEWTGRSADEILKDYYCLTRLYATVADTTATSAASKIDDFTEALKEREAVDGVVRQSVLTLLKSPNLLERLAKCTPPTQEAKKELDESIQVVTAKRDEKYLAAVATLASGKLWADYEQLRQIETKMIAWETQHAIDTILDSSLAQEKLAQLILAGIKTEKESGVLADLKKLAKLKTIPDDLVGRAVIETMIDERAPTTGPGAGGGTGGGGVSRKTLDARLKESETKTGNTIAAIERALRFDVNTKLEDLERKIKEPRPVSPEQLAQLQRGLTETVKTTVDDELARRGIGPVDLPNCEQPKKPTSDSNRRKAILQFNEGCSYFYSNCKEQMPSAVRCFSMATTLDPHDPVFRYFLGCTLYGEGRFVEALSQVQCAAETEKLRGARHDVPNRLERIQFGTRRWLERCRQPILQGM